MASRTPQGVRGLKLLRKFRPLAARWSHSARSAWIETSGTHVGIIYITVALRKECVD